MAKIGTRPIKKPQLWENYGQPPHVPKVEIYQPPAPELEFRPVIEGDYRPAFMPTPTQGEWQQGDPNLPEYESGGRGTRVRYDRSKNYITGTKDPWPWGLGAVPEHLTQYFYDPVRDPRDTEGFADWAKGRR